MKRRSYLSAVASSPLLEFAGSAIKSKSKKEVADIHKIHAHHNTKKGFIEYRSEDSFEVIEEYTDYYTWKKTAGEMAFRVDPEVTPVTDLKNSKLAELYNFHNSLGYSKLKVNDYSIHISSYESKFRVEYYNENESTRTFEAENKESIENELKNNNVI